MSFRTDNALRWLLVLGGVLASTAAPCADLSGRWTVAVVGQRISLIICALADFALEQLHEEDRGYLIAEPDDVEREATGVAVLSLHVQPGPASPSTDDHQAAAISPEECATLPRFDLGARCSIGPRRQTRSRGNTGNRRVGDVGALMVGTEEDESRHPRRIALGKG